MKTKKKDNWIVKVANITENLQYEVKYIHVYDSTKDEVLRYVQSLVGCSNVSVYKLEAIL